MKTLYKIMEYPEYGNAPPKLVNLVDNREEAERLIYAYKEEYPRHFFVVDELTWSS
jgi:hypothetical protein